MERFVRNVAIVTGASGGIGVSIVEELLKQGLIVVGLDINIVQLQKLADESKYQEQFHFMQCDITKEEEVEKTFHKINATIGPIHILVNNAGVNVKRFLDEVKEIDYDKVFNTNVKGLLLCAKEALKYMTGNYIQSHIVNINSVASLQLSKIFLGQMLYPASKHAARAISEGLRREITNKKLNIKVSDISPGLTETKFSSHINTACSDLEILIPQDVAKACISILDTPPNVLISELTIQPLFY